MSINDLLSGLSNFQPEDEDEKVIRARTSSNESTPTPKPQEQKVITREELQQKAPVRTDTLSDSGLYEILDPEETTRFPSTALRGNAISEIVGEQQLRLQPSLDEIPKLPGGGSGDSSRGGEGIGIPEADTFKGRLEQQDFTGIGDVLNFLGEEAVRPSEGGILQQLNDSLGIDPEGPALGILPTPGGPEKKAVKGLVDSAGKPLTSAASKGFKDYFKDSVKFNASRGLVSKFFEGLGTAAGYGTAGIGGLAAAKGLLSLASSATDPIRSEKLGEEAFDSDQDVLVRALQSLDDVARQEIEQNVRQQTSDRIPEIQSTIQRLENEDLPTSDVLELNKRVQSEIDRNTFGRSGFGDLLDSKKFSKDRRREIVGTLTFKDNSDRLEELEREIDFGSMGANLNLFKFSIAGDSVVASPARSFQDPKIQEYQTRALGILNDRIKNLSGSATSVQEALRIQGEMFGEAGDTQGSIAAKVQRRRQAVEAQVLEMKPNEQAFLKRSIILPQIRKFVEADGGKVVNGLVLDKQVINGKDFWVPVPIEDYAEILNQREGINIRTGL